MHYDCDNSLIPFRHDLMIRDVSSHFPFCGPVPSLYDETLG